MMNGDLRVYLVTHSGLHSTLQLYQQKESSGESLKPLGVSIYDTILEKTPPIPTPRPKPN